MPAIVDQWGRPIDQAVLNEPQTARVSALSNEYLSGSLDGLTPGKLKSILRDADQGNLIAQHRLFSDMEERDAHLYAEINKRKLALLSVDWTIAPPRNATAAEVAHAEWLTEVLTDAVDPIEDLILALMDGVGHGFAPVELEWRREGRELLPAFRPVPQEWFQLDQARRKIQLRDATPNGAELISFGWVFHTHGKPKIGYSGRAGLHRVLSWPFLYKAYGIGDFAEFLETFGLPIIVGKYFSGASAAEKSSLMHAVQSLGHDARAIMPAEMELEIQKIVGGGEKSPHLAMVDWADRAQSKAILGQTMSAESKSGGLGSGNADLHREVRHDILEADAREIAGTITRDLLYPLIALNRGNIDGLRRCPRLVFDCSEPEDIKVFADALPKLVAVGMRVKTEWAHEKLGIPLADEKDIVLSTAPATAAPVPSDPEALAALAANPKSSIPPSVSLSRQLSSAAQPTVDELLASIRKMIDEASDLASLQAALVNSYGDLDTKELTRLMSAAFALAELQGIDQVRAEASP